MFVIGQPRFRPSIHNAQRRIVATPVRNPRYSWLRTHGLRLIFFFAYAMMMLTILEQGRIIQAQQVLIRQLYPDSVKLGSAKAHQIQRMHRK